MSIDIMRKVFQISKTKGAGRLVLLALADNASDEGYCYPSVKTLSSKSAVSEPTTRDYLHAFEAIGLVKIIGRITEDGRQTSNGYHIDVSKIGQDEITPAIIFSVRSESRKAKTLNSPLTRVNPPPSNTGAVPPSNTGADESSVNHQERTAAKAAIPKSEETLPADEFFGKRKTPIQTQKKAPSSDLERKDRIISALERGNDLTVILREAIYNATGIEVAENKTTRAYLHTLKEREATKETIAKTAAYCQRILNDRNWRGEDWRPTLKDIMEHYRAAQETQESQPQQRKKVTHL